MAAIGGPPWRHGRDIDWVPGTRVDCTAWLADEQASAECAHGDVHDGVTAPHEGPLDERPDQVATWYDTDHGARPNLALPTGPLEVCS